MSGQPQLFQVQSASSVAAVELFPAVWQAAERFAAPREDTRHQALDELLKLGAPRFSPLVAYLLATRLSDPDLSLRARIIESLANVLRVDKDGRPAPDEVRGYLVHFMTGLDRETVRLILDVMVAYPEANGHLTKLFNLSYAIGEHLSLILADRNIPVDVRKIAAYFIGKIGFMEAMPTLERLRNRIQSRQDGQKTMPFAPPSSGDENNLLTDVNVAISMLKAGA